MTVTFDFSTLSDGILALFTSAARSCPTLTAIELWAVLEAESERRTIGAGRTVTSFKLEAESDVFTFMRDLWAITQAAKESAQVRNAADAGDLIKGAALFTAIGASLGRTPPPATPGGVSGGMVN
jgi:hypothetical protein